MASKSPPPRMQQHPPLVPFPPPQPPPPSQSHPHVASGSDFPFPTLSIVTPPQLTSHNANATRLSHFSSSSSTTTEPRRTAPRHWPHPLPSFSWPPLARPPASGADSPSIVVDYLSLPPQLPSLAPLTPFQVPHVNTSPSACTSATVTPGHYDMDPTSPFSPDAAAEFESPFMQEPHAVDSPVSYHDGGDGDGDSDNETNPSRKQTLKPAPLLRSQPPRRYTDTTFTPTQIRQGSNRPPIRPTRSYRSPKQDDDRVPPMGSIRMGTSALVSALTALPWDTEMEDAPSSVDDESEHGHDRLAETSVFPARPRVTRMHSSLHTIRPMDTGDETSPKSGRVRRIFHHNRSGTHLDFPFRENTIARRAQAPGKTEMTYQMAPTSDSDEHTDNEDNDEKRQRSERLAARLQEVFGLDDVEEVLEEMPCWLLRSVMLKGYMFLTRKRICFFAHMPDDETSVIKSGPLWKKASRTKLSTKYWFMLRNDVMSWYESANDPYFPKGNVSLQYASSCDSLGGARFKLRTTERNYTFTADTEANADEWIRVINKVIFKRQQEGETVRLIIPLDAVIDIELSPSLEFAETIDVKVVDSEDSMSVDSYFFASFPDNVYAYELMQRLLSSRPSAPLPKVSSDTALDSGAETAVPQRPASASSVRIIPKIGAAVLRPLGLGGTSSSNSRVPIAAPTRTALPDHDDPSDADQSGRESEVDDNDGYPPKQTGPPPPGMEQQPQSWRGSWIRNPAAKLFGTSPSSPGKLEARRKVRKRPSVTEVVEPAPLTSDDDFSDTESVHTLSPKAHALQPPHDPMEHQFHTFFALPEREELISTFSGSLYRVLPVHGRFFISTNYFCFRSSHLLYKTRMLVPIRDLYGMKAQKAFRFGHSGLIVIIKGYEELFLEFSSSKRRNDCMKLLEDRMEAIREASTPLSNAISSIREAKIVEDMDDALARSGPSTSLPSPMFSSAASSLLDFKPEPMKIVCLTIGSRGDVQPYIALCKGLQAEGHTTIIASHGEYRDWVEGHGIGFESIGGDPAELMRLCVDNGMFTVSFLKEGLQKFRAWLDDLLMSSWEACQGAQLLIESPSAMAGIHIAEALQIPYYRAFTMPWTRTRAYPQAFAVPENKRGGSYNYMTYVMFDQVFWRAISGQINRWRKQTLHLEATTLDKMQQDKVPFLYNFSPVVVPPPLDWTEWIHVTGYWFLDHADGHKQKAWSPPAGLVEFIDTTHARGQKVVYIGFGSIVVSDPAEMTRCVVEAVVQSGVCAILSKGWSDRGQRKDEPAAKEDTKDGADGVKYPDTIYAIDSIDHSWLFPKIDAACHHGGAGTTGASLRAGIPTIIKPFFGDQAFWAERVESLGVGTGIRKLTSEELSEALIQATTNDRQIAKAKAVGEEIRRERGVQRAIQCIYRDLEYAKSLIKPLPSDDKSLPKKVTSTIYHGHRKVRQSISQVFSGTDRDNSDESWSVVSGSRRGSQSQTSSPLLDSSSRRGSQSQTSSPLLDSSSHSRSNSISKRSRSESQSQSQPPSRNRSCSRSRSTSKDATPASTPASGGQGSDDGHLLRGIPGIGPLVNHLFAVTSRDRDKDREKKEEEKKEEKKM